MLGVGTIGAAIDHYSQLPDVCKNDCYCIWVKNWPEPQDFGVMQ